VLDFSSKRKRMPARLLMFLYMYKRDFLYRSLSWESMASKWYSVRYNSIAMFLVELWIVRYTDIHWSYPCPCRYGDTLKFLTHAFGIVLSFTKWSFTAFMQFHNLCDYENDITVPNHKVENYIKTCVYIYIYIYIYIFSFQNNSYHIYE
jgi:hypothetical protein